MTNAIKPVIKPRLNRLAALISDLRLAITLLVVIALSSAVGTAVPQKETEAFYHRLYDPQPWLGLFDAEWLLALQLDHVYSSSWFLALLAWLALALLLCSWRRQWPALRAALRWIDYRSPRQLSKLSLAETVSVADSQVSLDRLEELLRRRGWQLQRHSDRLAARQGLIGRAGPLLVHAGLVVLMLGAAWGALGGQRLEQFLAPGRTLELVDSRGHGELTLALDRFTVQRDPAGRPEQFSSALRILQPEEEAATNDGATLLRQAEISVNHPLRFQGVTFYQADWGLAALTLQLGRSPLLQLPLEAFPQIGEQIWGLLLPTRPDGSKPVLLLVSNEQGPVDIYGSDGERLGQLVVGGPPVDVDGLPVRLEGILPASGILLKRDPGVPLVYSGFAIALLGGGLSLVATRQLWAIAEPGQVHVAALSNRGLTGLSEELPELVGQIR
jgi:cytochrome c biogenesis protein